MRLQTILLSLGVLFAGGCAGFFEQQIEVDTLPYERQLVLNTILSPQDSLIRADVFVTAPAVGDPPPNYPRNGVVQDAQVRLISPAGDYLFEFSSSGAGRSYVLPQETVQLEAGQTYEVVAEWDGLTARGQTTIPRLAIVRDSIVLQEVVEQDGDRNVQTRWPNQSGELDYYFLFTDETFRPGGGVPPQTQRVLNDYLHGRDALGPYVSVEFGILPDAENTLNICQCTQATYDYFLTRETAEVNDDNPFAEPTTVANNLEEGLGLIGAINCWQFKI